MAMGMTKVGAVHVGEMQTGKPEPLPRQRPEGERDAPPMLVQAIKRRNSPKPLATLPVASLAVFKLSK